MPIDKTIVSDTPTQDNSHLGYYYVAIPYRHDYDVGGAYLVDGWVSYAYPMNTNRWVGFVAYHDIKAKSYRSWWTSRKTFNTRELALRCAARVMVIIIAQETAVR